MSWVAWVCWIWTSCIISSSSSSWSSKPNPFRSFWIKWLCLSLTHTRQMWMVYSKTSKRTCSCRSWKKITDNCFLYDICCWGICLKQNCNWNSIETRYSWSRMTKCVQPCRDSPILLKLWGHCKSREEALQISRNAANGLYLNFSHSSQMRKSKMLSNTLWNMERK